jgi:hypothetical protein
MTDVQEISIETEAKDVFKETLKKNGIELIPPKNYEVPEKPFFDMNDRDESLKSTIYDVFVEYLNFPILKDNFPTHHDRRKWRQETFDSVQNTYGNPIAMRVDKLITENKMKRNKFSYIWGFSEMGRDFIPKEKLEKMEQFIKEISQPKGGNDPWD